MKYKITERFTSINGEGTRAGQLAVFLRFHGCNLSCGYCDTSWANKKDTIYTEYSGTELYQYIKSTGISNVTLTGGEPLIQPYIKELLVRLSKDLSLNVEIETNGSIPIQEIQAITHPPSLTMDYKLPSCGMESYMLTENFTYLQNKDTVKFVIGCTDDLEKAGKIINTYDLTKRCHVYFSPVYNQIHPADIVDFMKAHHNNGVNLQLQLHKFIWPPDKRGV